MELTTFTMWKASDLTAKPKVPKTPAAIRPMRGCPIAGAKLNQLDLLKRLEKNLHRARVDISSHQFTMCLGSFASRKYVLYEQKIQIFGGIFIKIPEASNESLPVQLYLRSGIKRADIARLVALSVYGGVPALAIVRAGVRYSWNLTSRLVSFNNSCSLKGFKR